MSTLKDKIAVVTGASSGIGKAIALGLAEQGAILCLVGRKLEALETVAENAKGSASKVLNYQLDLTIDEDIHQLKTQLSQDFEAVDLLIHSAGVFSMGLTKTAPIQDLDWQYRINVRAPYALTQALLPMITTSQGQIVFINSTVGLTARASVGQYAASKHALKAIADSLREEVNADGVRVISVYPGRTVSPMQATVRELEGKDYHPEQFLQPEDVASVVINALNLPHTAEVTDINIRPMKKI